MTFISTKTRQDIINDIQEELIDIANRENICLDYVVVFGSIARGDYNEESDFDLLVISEDWNEDSLLGRGGKLSKHFPSRWPHVDIICRTPNEIKEPIDSKRTVSLLEEEGEMIIKDNKPCSCDFDVDSI